MNDNYYKYKKYKHLYKQQNITVGGTNNCQDIIKAKKETFHDWKTRCRDNQLCVINNKSRQCQVNPNNITININEMTGESYPVMINSPYTVDVLFRMLSQEKRRCKLFRVGAEDPLPMYEDLKDGEVIFRLPNPSMKPIMDRNALRGLVKIWCRNISNDKLSEIYGHISEWDVGNVTDMSEVFSDWGYDDRETLNITNNFNDDISEWDVSNVTNMRDMFLYASSFNQPLDKWDVSNVTTMKYMFMNAKSFNQPLITQMVTINGKTYNAWDVSNIINMRGMFMEAERFNQPLDNWDVSNVINMSNMFIDAISFNQSLNTQIVTVNDKTYTAWDVNDMCDLTNMFNYAENLDHNNVLWYQHFE